MIDIKVGWAKTAADQVRLHVIAAVADAVQGDRRVRVERMSVPQITPAGLGSTVPARGRVDAAGSDIVARLEAARSALEITSSERDRQRVEGWERVLTQMDAYQHDPSRTPRDRRGEIRTLPRPVYVVTIRELRVTGPGVVLHVPYQRIELDLSEPAPEVEEAFRMCLMEEAAPVTGSRGEQLRRAPRVRDAVWVAWCTLADCISVAVDDQLAQQNCEIA